MLPDEIHEIIRGGTVIPAVPLALNARRRFDARRQRALMRYYLDAGAGGLAVGMHFTQFQIRRPEVGLYEPVLRACGEEADRWSAERGRAVVKVAGVDGTTAESLEQTAVARELGYHVAIVSMTAFKDASVAEMLAHVERIAAEMPVFGFYLLTGVGGVALPYAFWRGLVEIDNVCGIKIAPFNRYGTVDVVRAVAEAGKADRIALYTGNDESILHDLLTPFRFGESAPEVRIRGGLLGQWACWTRRAVELLERVHGIVDRGEPIGTDLFTLAGQITDANAAIFDAAHGFAGSIPGVNEVLRRQGLLEGTWTLDPEETLSPGQAEEITRVCNAYPHLTDDDFVAENLQRWLDEAGG